MRENGCLVILVETYYGRGSSCFKTVAISNQVVLFLSCIQIIYEPNLYPIFIMSTLGFTKMFIRIKESG